MNLLNLIQAAARAVQAATALPIEHPLVLVPVAILAALIVAAVTLIPELEDES